ESNVCDDNKNVGIRVSGERSAPKLSANQCRNNGFGMVFEKGAQGEAVENICDKNKDSGIEVVGKKTQPKLTSNFCRGNGRYGIWCEVGSDAKLADNKTSDNREQNLVTNGQLAK